MNPQGFLPKAAIAAGGGDWLADETRALVRTRLREMTVIYGLIFGMFVILRPFLLGLPTASISTPFWGAIALLGGLAFYLSSRHPISLARLGFLELVMVIALASFHHLLSDQPFHRAFVGRGFGQGTVDHEEFCAPDIDLDTHLWDLRPEELAQGRAGISGLRPDPARLDTGYVLVVSARSAMGVRDVARMGWSP